MNEVSLVPEQIDAIEILFLVALLSVPIAWLYAQKRGRRPWVWSLIAFFNAWVAVLLLRLQPVGGSQPAQSVSKSDNDEADDGRAVERTDEIEAQKNLRKLLGKEN